jgi:hypothetical protein
MPELLGNATPNVLNQPIDVAGTMVRTWIIHLVVLDLLELYFTKPLCDRIGSDQIRSDQLCLCVLISFSADVAPTLLLVSVLLSHGR